METPVCRSRLARRPLAEPRPMVAKLGPVTPGVQRSIDVIIHRCMILLFAGTLNKSGGIELKVSKRSETPIKAIYKLFPDGPAKLIAKIAGIPKPKSCL